MATIKEVASRAGVSIGTASNVLTGSRPVSPAAKERVRDLPCSPKQDGQEDRAKECRLVRGPEEVR